MKKYFIFILIAGSLIAQETDTITFNHTSKKINIPDNNISVGMSTYNNDFLLGVSYNHTINAQMGLSFKSSLWIRPFQKNVLHQEDFTTYYIFRENRIQLIFGLEEMLPLNDVIAIHGSISVSPAMFFYMGSNRDYLDLVAPVIESGFSFNVAKSNDLKNKLRIDIGYRFSREESNRHGIYLMLRMAL